MRMNLKGLTGREKKEWRANKMEPERRDELIGKMMAHKLTEMTLKRSVAIQKAKTRETLPKPRKPIRKVSDKQRAINKEYSKLRKEFLAESPLCAVCGALATDVHHRKFRGKHMLDVSSWLPVCRFDHNRIHDNPAWAKENGWILR